jgi:hypothetical protein
MGRPWVRRKMHIEFWWGNTKIPHGRYRNRWESTIKMELKITGWKSTDWIHLRVEQVASFCEQSNEPSGPIKVWGISCLALNFSRTLLHGVRL